jgi:predicted GNAT family N-acyltransferase
MNISEISEDNPLYEVALALRYAVFFEPFGLPKSVTADEMEPQSTHIAITEHNELIAYGRLSPLGENEFRISQIVVDPKHQKRGLSTKLLERLMNEARLRGAERIRLSSQVSVQALYENLGFKAVGETYIVKLTGVPHVKMVYEVAR